MNGFNVSEAGHIINLIPPVDGNAGAPVTCQRFSLKEWAHASIIVQLGVTAAAPTSILLAAYTAASSGTRTALPFTSYAQTTAGTANDTLTGPTNNAATGITAVSANDGIFYVIEIDASALPDGSPYIQLELTNPASSILNSAVAILSAGRFQYQGNVTATA